MYRSSYLSRILTVEFGNILEYVIGSVGSGKKRSTCCWHVSLLLPVVWSCESCVYSCYVSRTLVLLAILPYTKWALGEVDRVPKNMYWAEITNRAHIGAVCLRGEALICTSVLCDS